MHIPAKRFCIPVKVVFDQICDGLWPLEVAVEHIVINAVRGETGGNARATPVSGGGGHGGDQVSERHCEGSNEKGPPDWAALDQMARCASGFEATQPEQASDCKAEQGKRGRDRHSADLRGGA